MSSNIPTSDDLNAFSKNTLSEQLGIEYTVISKDRITARMPVDHRTKQPFGFLHGGASAALAETLASVGGAINLDRDKQNVVGLALTINHIKSVASGWVYGEAIPIHIGKKTQVWEIKIKNEQDQLVSDARLTLANIPKK